MKKFIINGQIFMSDDSWNWHNTFEKDNIIITKEFYERNPGLFVELSEEDKNDIKFKKPIYEGLAKAKVIY